MAKEQIVFERTVAEAIRRAKLLFATRAGNQSSSGNASTTQAGLVPPVPDDPLKFLNGEAPPSFMQVKDSDLAVSDVATNNVSIAHHGFAPKAPNDATKYLDGTGAYSTPAGSSSGGGASPAALTDLTDLAAWFAADDSSNTVAPNTGVITVFHDKSGNGHTFTPGSGKVLKQYAGLAGSPVASFAIGMTAVSGITIPLKGAMTFFAVVKVTSSVAYQNLFKPSGAPTQPSDMHVYWDQPTNKWQVDGSVAGTAVAGAYHTIVVHFYNVGGAMHFKVRQDGTQILGDTASTNGSNPVPGSGGSPTNFGLNLFRDSTGLPFTSQIAEWGFYAISKDGSEATLEDYLRAKYATW